MSHSNSSPQANQTQTTTTKDNRIAAAENSINLVESSGNSVTVNALDGGAVGRSFDFAEAVSQGAATLAAASVQNMQESTRTALSAVQDAYQDENDKLSQAWADAKAGEQKLLSYGVMAAVAVVAVSALGRAR